MHNDAAYLSHDLYDAFRNDQVFELADYAPEVAEIENFFGLNVPPEYEQQQAEEYVIGPIQTLIESAIAVSPLSEDTVLRIDPALNHLVREGIFEADIIVDARDQNVNAVAIHLNFDSSKLRVVDEGDSPTDEIKPGEGFGLVLTNQADNGNGRIDFEASTVGGQSLSGTFRVATIRMRGIGTAAGTLIDILSSGGRRSLLLEDGLEVPHEQIDGVVVITEGATIQGDTNMEGRPQGPRWAVPLYASLHQAGQGDAMASYFVDANNAGDFVVTGTDIGTFDIKVKGNHTLGSVTRAVSLHGGVNPVFFGTLVEGDTNNDNVIDMLDVSALQASYGKSAGQAGFNQKCDLDESGQVDIADISLLNSNFGRTGDVSVAGGRPALAASSRPLRADSCCGSQSAQEYMTVRLDPDFVEAKVGEYFHLTLEVDAGDRTVDGVQIYLDFDPDILRVVNAQGDPVASIVDAEVFDNVIENSVDNASGQVNFIASALQNAKPTGTFGVATMRFRVHRDTTATRIRFASATPRFSRIAVGGEYPLLRYVPAQVYVSVQKVNLPLIRKG